MNKLKIKPELLELLMSRGFDVFTCPTLTEAYFALPTCASPSKHAARKVVARAINRLKSEGLVESCSGGKRAQQYQLTESFFRVTENLMPKSDQPLPTAPSERELIASLKTRLHDYKVELMEAIGEIEEYEAMSECTPEKLPQIQILYSRARDHFSKTQGRVKAIQAMLSQLQPS